jgi:hypothetical protein
MAVVTELELVNSRWGGGGTGFPPGEPQPTAARLVDAGEGAGAKMRAMPKVLLAVRERRTTRERLGVWLEMFRRVRTAGVMFADPS